MNTVKPGEIYRLYGRLIIKNGRRYLQNPRFINDNGWIPVYRNIPGLPQKSYRKLVEAATEHIDEIHPEYFPYEFRKLHDLCNSEFAFREIHFPTRMENIIAAKKRISFEQMLLYMIRVSCAAGEKKKHSRSVEAGNYYRRSGRLFRFRQLQLSRRFYQKLQRICAKAMQ